VDSAIDVAPMVMSGFVFIHEVGVADDEDHAWGELLTTNPEPVDHRPVLAVEILELIPTIWEAPYLGVVPRDAITDELHAGIRVTAEVEPIPNGVGATLEWSIENTNPSMLAERSAAHARPSSPASPLPAMTAMGTGGA